jgi:preprotein translocase SecE subunit
MSKKDKNKTVAPLADPVSVVQKPAESQEPVKAEGADKQEKVKSKKVVKKEKRPNIFVRIGRKLKEVFSELKKVTWPTFPTVLKQTGIVVVVVLFFLLLIFGFDTLLSTFYMMLKK